MTVAELCMGCMEDRHGAEVCAACGWVEGAPPENPIHLKPRTVLRDHYVLGRSLGHGGFGIVYLAWDEDLEMRVAVKEFLPGDYATRGPNGTTVTPYSGESREHFEYSLTKFLEEGRAVARFNDHPGIMPVLGFFRENGTGYLVMQYVPGMSLKKYLALKGGRIPFADALGLAMPVMDTLRAVHEVGLLHRDISPDNIYISASKRVKLLDFGAARQAMGDRSKSLSVILKAGYAPIEQYQTRGRQGPWTDVYALAATIYRSITGETPPDSISRKAQDDLVAPRAAGVAMPAEAEAALLKAMAVDQAQRFQTVEAFQQAMLGAAHGQQRSEAEVAKDIDAAVREEAEAEAEQRRRQGLAGVGGGSLPPLDFGAAGANAARGLAKLIDVLDRPASIVTDLVGSTIGLRLPSASEASLRQPALIAALIVGLLGMIGTLPLLTMVSGMTGSLPVLVAVVRAVAGFAGAGAMALGGGAGLAGDRRGAPLAWASGWALIAAGVAGAALQVVSYLPSTAMSFLGFFISNEIAMLVRSLWLTVVVLVLFWLRRRADAAADAAPGPSR